MPDLTVGVMAAQLDNLNTLGPTGSQSSWGQEAVLNYLRPGECTCPKGQHEQSNILKGLTPVDLWHWVINHDVPRSERREASAPASAT